MATQIQLEQKLAEVSKKLKFVCQSYTKLKEQIRGKDEQIGKLKMEIARLMEVDEMKQNNKVKDIRRKYQVQSTFRPIVPRVELENNQSSRLLKYSKSLSPYQFAKPLQQSSQPIKYPNKLLQKQKDSKKQPNPSPFTLNDKKLPPNLPSVIDLNKSRTKNYQIMEIDHKYAKDLDIKQSQSEALMLKQLWQERDKQIKRMDDLFETLNKKIYGS